MNSDAMLPRALDADVGFVFIGGAHQVLHLAPVAAELSRLSPDLRVACLYSDEVSGEVLAQVRAALNAPGMRLIRVDVPWPGRLLARLLRRRALAKGPLLVRLSLLLRRARAIVVPERTSAALRWMRWWHGLLIHFRHGAGDRAPASEKRMAVFDLVVVAGEKDVRHAVEVRRVAPAHVRAAGYVKLDYLAGSSQPPLSAGSGRPLVIYNPHFDARISSWRMARAVIARFASQDRYDLIFAPHIRCVEDMDRAERAEWQALAVPGRIIIDLESPRLLDMSWLRAADVYLGDRSSQLYEFLVTPRPAAFIDAHGVDWQGDPRFAGWHLGEVARGPDEVIAAVDRAVARHAAVSAAQGAAVTRAFGDYRGASTRGAAIIAEAIYGPSAVASAAFCAA